MQTIQNNQSELPVLIGTLQDITDRVNAQQSAKANEAIYKTFLNSSYDLVYLKDSSLHYIAVNTNMQKYRITSYNVCYTKLLRHTMIQVLQRHW